MRLRPEAIKKNVLAEQGKTGVLTSVYDVTYVELHYTPLGVTLAKKQCRLDIRKFSFSQRTVNEWNRLSADCVGASSVNIFKNKIDIYLKRAGYT